MGLPGAGKSTAARAFVDEGYARLNRDAAGGSLGGLLPDLQRLVDEGSTRIVLDNTYMSRASRARVVQAGTQLGLPVRCVWIATSVEDAQVNAVSRIIANHGRLLGPEEMKQAVKRDISAFAPGVQFRHQRELEPPDPSEGFSRIDVVPFERKHNAAMINRALIVWCDDTLAGRGPVSNALATRAGCCSGWRGAQTSKPERRLASRWTRTSPGCRNSSAFRSRSSTARTPRVRRSAGAASRCPDSASSSSSAIASIRRNASMSAPGRRTRALRDGSDFSIAILASSLPPTRFDTLVRMPRPPNI